MNQYVVAGIIVVGVVIAGWAGLKLLRWLRKDSNRHVGGRPDDR